MRLFVRLGRRLRARAIGDGGISLIEVVMALMIIAVVMTSAAGFFLHSLKTTGGAASRQTAVDVTNQELENIRAVPAGSLLTGRTQSAVQALLAWPGAANLTAFDDITNAGGVQNFDPQATNPNGAAVPTVTTQTVNNQVFTLHNFIDPCWLPVGTAQSAATQNLACGANPTPPAGQKTTVLLRVTVATSWTGGAATDCTNGCTYAASSLVDPHSDPQFQSNISHPTITGINPSTIAQGATVTVIVSGSGFKYGVAATTCGNATVGTIDQSTTTDNTIRIPITAGSTSGSCTLTVTNPDGGNASTTFNISNPPVVASVSPAVQNYTSGSVTITGSSFANPTVSPASGTWSGTTYSGTTGITGTYKANAPSAGTVPVTVTNGDGGQATGSITVTQSTPQLTLVTSTTIAAGSTSTVTINGTDLAPSGATPTVNRGSVSNVTASGTSVTFAYTAPSTTGATTVTVTNPDGGRSTVTLTVVNAAPTITSVSGAVTCSGFLYWGGCYYGSFSTTYTVTGSNFGTSPTVALKLGSGSFVTVQASGTGTSLSFTQANNPGNVAFTIKVTTSAGSASKSGTVSGP